MNVNATEPQTCRSCGGTGSGNYCSTCGQPYKIRRLSVNGILHDAMHYFTHLESGFWYTLKQLLVAPGTMQRLYIDGARRKYQKPFSMFLICVTIATLSRYWIYELLLKYFHTGSAGEASFTHHYMELLYAFLIPLLALLTWALFRKSKYNYAEIAVMQLYSFSFFFIMATIIALLKLVWHKMDTAYIELPVFIIYNIITFINFFRESRIWNTVLKSILLTTLIFMTGQVLEDNIINWLKH